MRMRVCGRRSMVCVCVWGGCRWFQRVCEGTVNACPGRGARVEEGYVAKAHQETLGPWHHVTGVILVTI